MEGVVVKLVCCCDLWQKCHPLSIILIIFLHIGYHVGLFVGSTNFLVCFHAAKDCCLPSLVEGHRRVKVRVSHFERTPLARVVP